MKEVFIKALAKCNVFVLAAIVAAGLLVAVWMLNILLYSVTGDIIGLPMSGGDIIVTSCFGLVLEHYYPCGPIDQEVEDSTSLTISPVGAIAGYVILFVVSIFIACAIKNKAEWMLIKNVK